MAARKFEAASSSSTASADPRSVRATLAPPDIAEALSLSRERVKQLRVSLGLEPRGKPRVYVTWTPKMDEQVRREYIVGGKSAAMVAHEMGLSRCAVIGRAHRLGYSRAIASEPSA